MECPHCSYEHGYNMDLNGDVKGEEGDFYILSNSIHMTRSNEYNDWEMERTPVYACPNCKKLFIE